MKQKEKTKRLEPLKMVAVGPVYCANIQGKYYTTLHYTILLYMCVCVLI